MDPRRQDVIAGRGSGCKASPRHIRRLRHPLHRDGLVAILLEQLSGDGRDGVAHALALAGRRPVGGGIGFGFELNFDQNCTVFNFLVNEEGGRLGRAAIGRQAVWRLGGEAGQEFP